MYSSRLLYFSAFIIFSSFVGIFLILNVLESKIIDEALVANEKSSESVNEISTAKIYESVEVLTFHERLNLINPGHLGELVQLPTIVDSDIQEIIDSRKETYKFNEFVSSLIPLNRELPDFREEACKALKYPKTFQKPAQL